MNIEEDMEQNNKYIQIYIKNITQAHSQLQNENCVLMKNSSEQETKKYQRSKLRNKIQYN